MDFYDILLAKKLSGGGGPSVLVEPLSVTQNGTYQEEGKAYSPVNVNVPTGITPTGTLSVSQNGTYDVTNYASADVDVPSEVIFRTLSIINNRSTGTVAQKRISLMIYSVDANQQVQCMSTNVNGSASKDITMPFVTTGQDFIVIRTPSTTTEPVFASNEGAELIGHMVSTSVRYSIVKIPVGNPISLTVS